MKIIREGKEIELTSTELFDAYVEQEHLFDIQNIINNMVNNLSEDEYEKLKDNRDFIEYAADELRRNQDKYDMDFEYALPEAIRKVKGDFLNIQNDIKKSYFEVHVTFGEKDGDGYSIFVELDGPAGAQDALDKVRDEHLYQEPEDLNNIDYIDEIDEHQYYECIGKEMPVESWEDVHMKYPTDRDEMDEETEKAFVEDCFRLYEKEGFSEIYWSPFTDNEDRKGQKVEILGRCTIEDNDLCVLPMWKAKFSDGKILDVYPEEVIPSEMRANGCRLFDDKKTSLTSQIQTATARTQSSKKSPDIKSKETFHL